MAPRKRYDARMAELNRLIDNTSKVLEALDNMVEALGEAADALADARDALASGNDALGRRMRDVELRCRAAVRLANQKTSGFLLVPIVGGKTEKGD